MKYIFFQLSKKHWMFLQINLIYSTSLSQSPMLQAGAFTTIKFEFSRLSANNWLSDTTFTVTYFSLQNYVGAHLSQFYFLFAANRISWKGWAFLFYLPFQQFVLHLSSLAIEEINERSIVIITVLIVLYRSL